MHWLACIDILIKVLSGQLKGKKNRLMKIKLSKSEGVLAHDSEHFEQETDTKKNQE